MTGPSTLWEYVPDPRGPDVCLLHTSRLETRTKESGIIANSPLFTVACLVKTNFSYIVAHAIPSSIARGDELLFWDPKDCELYSNWWKPEETLVDDLVTMLTCKSLV